MKAIFLKILQFIFKLFEGILLFISGYLTCVYIFALIIVNDDNIALSSEPKIEIFLHSNGVHTDIVVPTKNRFIDWTKFVDPSETKSGKTNYKWTAFGWGDKGFYLETPTWAELKPSIAFNAMFGLSKTAMHVSFYSLIKESPNCKKADISISQYMLLIQNIKNQFKETKPQRLSGKHYNSNDSFYNAKGTYHIFKTCNTWVNQTLKNSKMKACLWTPFDRGILNIYD